MGEWQTEAPPARLFAIMARKAPVAVIFRRGPTDWVRLLRWDTETDEIQPGQWFKGRIYVRRCDLSPDGRLLVYFVRKIEARTIQDDAYTYAWTAVSRPPYLTALALWPKGDCWAGGGLFESDRKLWLNHHPAQATPHPNHQPKKLRVAPNPGARGEDEPIYRRRLERDGWKLVDEWELTYQKQLHYVTTRPEVRALPHPTKKQRLLMTRSLDGFEYREQYVVEESSEGFSVPLERGEWAGWDPRERLVVLRDGQVQVGHLGSNGELELDVLADLNDQRFEPIKSPTWARRWP